MSFTTSMQRSLAVPAGSEALSGEGRTTGSRLEAAGLLPFFPPNPACLWSIPSSQFLTPSLPNTRATGAAQQLTLLLPGDISSSPEAEQLQSHRAGAQGDTTTPAGGWAPTDVPPLQGYRGWATQNEPKSHGWQAPGSSPGAYRAARPRR